MYRANGTYYTEEHSISFGGLVTRTSGGLSYEDFTVWANTWSDWHLIPSSRLSIAHPTFVSKFIEIPGADGMLDLTEYLTGRPVFGQRQGTLDFFVANFIENWETIRDKMVRVLHGKKIKMRLMDDPTYYYDGRFTVGQWQSGADHSSIQISYQLDPYKLKICKEGSVPQLWDTFNFETDYDYYTVMSPNITVSGTAKTFYIYAGDYAFAPTVTWVSGSVTASFGGVSKTLSSAGSQVLGNTHSGQNTLTVSGTGSIKIEWRGGSI